MRCTNCSCKTASPFVYRGVTSYLCAECRQRLSLAIAAVNRYRAVMLGMLGHRRL
jgi:hypothetical protein